MSHSNEPIAVQIMDREFRVNCAPGEREALQRAALHLDRQMRDLRERGRGLSLESVAIMAALNLSDEVLKLQLQLAQHREHVDARLQTLADRLDQQLVDTNPPAALD
ncbi:MAG: cell division protein ZapA [Wenzhouxiangellaceae bacterium]